MKNEQIPSVVLLNFQEIKHKSKKRSLILFCWLILFLLLHLKYVVLKRMEMSVSSQI